jgi:hypothetical protein
MNGKMARDGSYIFPVVVTFKTSNRSNAKVKQKVIRNKNVDEVLDVKTKIPGIPEKAVILEVGLGKSFINTLFRASRRFVKKLDIDQDKHYVFFKNNCPMRGPLRDDFRICDRETGDVLFTVTPTTGRVEVWGSENHFSEALFEGHSLNSFYNMREV